MGIRPKICICRCTPSLRGSIGARYYHLGVQSGHAAIPGEFISTTGSWNWHDFQRFDAYWANFLSNLGSVRGRGDVLFGRGRHIFWSFDFHVVSYDVSQVVKNMQICISVYYVRQYLLEVFFMEIGQTYS